MLLFQRLGTSTLYIGNPASADPANHLGEVLLILPEASSELLQTMTLEEAWAFQHPTGGAGYILFLDAQSDFGTLTPQNAGAFASRLHALLPRYVRNHSLSLGWVSGTLATPTLQTLSMVRIEGDVRTQNIPQVIRFLQLEIMVLPGAPFELNSDGSGFRLFNTEYLAPPGADPSIDLPTNYRIYLRAGAPYDMDKVGASVGVALMGPDRGSLLFDIVEMTAFDIDVGKLDTSICYVVPEPDMPEPYDGRDQTMRFPLLNLEPTHSGKASQITLLAKLYPSNQPSSIFRFKDSNGNDGQLESYFRTFNGYPVHLVPQDDAGLVFSKIPNPGVYPSRAAEVERHYNLVPTGRFAMHVDEPFPQGDTYHRLMGGNSGTEYISFVNGDLLCFFPDRPAYAHGFEFTPDPIARRVHQNGSTLLDTSFRTSWLSVTGPSGPNGHIHYYAQPDDAALHGQETTDYLKYVEVETASLKDPSELHCFPMAPLSGVIAPDDRVSAFMSMEKYLLFEQKTLNPARKTQITYVAGEVPSVTRSLLNTPTTQYTTTPQGMLVTVTGSDWQQLTLARDDETPNPNFLRFPDISDEFQDALSTNRLFLVATDQQALLEQGGQFVDNLLRVQGWPFRFDIGQAPNGFPAPGEGLDSVNNVLIFKFVNKPLAELATDSLLWSRPDDFNNHNTDTIQEWLLEFIQDVRDRVSDAEEDDDVDGYDNLLTILNNPNWTGVLGLNVTVPPDQLPCEVQPLLAGIRNMPAFKAHHVGFSIGKVSPNAQTIERSSIFGLIDYSDTPVITPGLGEDFFYEFIVLTLLVRFANSEIASFDSDIRIVMLRLFDENTYAQPGNWNYVDLEGSYKMEGGKPSYAFSTPFVFGPKAFTVYSKGSGVLPLVNSVEITKAELVSGTCVLPNSSDRTSKAAFKFNGSLDFSSIVEFDFFSFDKLKFTGLALNMEFTIPEDSVPPRYLPDYKFEPGDLRLDVGLSKLRENSLLANFPLKVESFHYNEAGINFAAMGYFEIPTFVPGWNGAKKPKYGIAFTLDLGALSSILKKGAPKGAIQVLAAWGPTIGPDDPDYEPGDEGGDVSFGITLGKGANGKKEIGIEGVFIVSLSDFGFQKIATNLDNDGVEDYVYCLYLSNAYLKILGVQLPPGGNFSLVLFVPFNGKSDKVSLANLGWFVSYERGEGESAGTATGAVSVSVETAPDGTFNQGRMVTITVTVNTGSFDMMVNATVRTEVVATDDSPPTGVTGKPLPPTPPSITQPIAASVGTTTYSFTWPASQSGKFKVKAYVTTTGEGNKESGSGESASFTVSSVDGGTPPGGAKDSPVLKVDYLGLGNRVTVPLNETEAEILEITSVEKMIDTMKAKMPIRGTGPEAVGVAQQLTSIYRPNGGLLVGLDLTIFNVFRLAVVFAQDLQIYGGLIGFVEDAPAFIRNFKFQVLYKPVTDDIGVFHILLQLPDYLRRWDVGKGTLTLPIIGIDIYTNGNFKLDLGFPYDFDFSRSLSFEIIIWLVKIPIPLVWSVGFYFSYLTGATSTLVPVLSDPDDGRPENEYPMFDPVFEAGFGLRFGLGREMNYGPLKAGAVIALVAMLEGAMAWYWPNGRSSTGKLPLRFPDWFRVAGQAGLVGRIYGIVDFKIIKASVNVELKAIFHFVFETYRDLRFGITMSVSVSASISVGLFSISFSFSASFTFEFSIPNPMGPPPWTLLESVSMPIERSLLDGTDKGPIVWKQPTDQLWFESTLPWQTLGFSMQVVVTGGRNDAGTGSQTNAVVLFAMAMDDARRVVTAATRWALASYLNGNFAANATLTLEQLEDLDSRLNPQPEAGSVLGNPGQLIPYNAIRSFLFTTFPTKGRVNPPSGAELAVFPAFPETTLSWGFTGSSNSPRNLDTYNRPAPGYLDDLADYFDLLRIDVLDKTDIVPARSLLETSTKSMAEIIFEDYFEMVIKAGVSQVVEWVRADPAMQPNAQGVYPRKTVERIHAFMNAPGPGGMMPAETVARMANRYFAHGLRVPRTFPGTSPDYEALSETAEGLYALTGQQIALVNPNEDWTFTADVNLPGMSGIDFGYTLTEDDVARELFYRNPSANFYNGFNAPAPMDPLGSEDRMFAFRPKAGYGTGFLYPLPEVMITRLMDRATEMPFPAMTAFNEGGTELTIGNSSWALSVPFTAKRVYRSVETTITATEGANSHTFDGMQDEPIPNAYEIGGTDERTREIISAYLAGGADATDIRMFYKLAGQTSVLHPLPFVNAGIQKVNLSTVSAPQSTQLQEVVPAHPGYSADFEGLQADAVLGIIWEASIVNASGYYMYFDGGGQESGLPDTAFGSVDGRAELVLLVSINGSAAGANVLDVRDADFEEGDLHATVAGELSYAPAIAQGAVAFELERDRPPDTVAGDSAIRYANDLARLYSLLSYQIIDPGGTSPFRKSIHGLPVGPLIDDDTTTWVYRQGIKLFRYLKMPPAGVSQRYSAIGETVTLGFEFLDVFGNRLALADEAAGLATLELPVRYTDPLTAIGTWSGIGLGYSFSTSGNLTVTISFDADGFDADGDMVAGPPSEANLINEYAGRREAALTSYRQVLEQLNGPGVSVTFGTTVAPALGRPNQIGSIRTFVQQAISFLDPTVSNAPAPTDVTFSVNLDPLARNSQSDDIFPIRVDVSITREDHLIARRPNPDPAGEDLLASDFLPEIREARTWVPAIAVTTAVDYGTAPPQSDEAAYANWLNNRQSMAYEPFAKDFEQAFSEFKVATGLGEDGPHTLWAVRMLSGSGLGYSYGGAPSFFAPPPLSQVLRSRDDVPVRETYWGPADGPEDNLTEVGFTDIDMDVWGREFLETVDRFLSPEIAVTARRIADGGGPGPYGRIVEAKKKIADAIAKTVTWVTDPAPSSQAMTDAAQEQYRQRILVTLSSAYDVETAVVFPTNTSGPGANAPRVYGVVSGVRPGSPAQNDEDPEAGYSFTPAKVDLSGGTSYLPVMFSSGRTHSYAAVTLDIEYSVTHIEHDIQTAQGGYQASSWLTLVRPTPKAGEGRNTKVDLNTVDIPVALREYPRKPELVSQRVIPTVHPDDVTTIQQAKGWNYHYSMLQPAVPHDTTFSRIDFNVADPDPTRSLLGAGLDLFDWLARFHWEYPRSIGLHINKLSAGAKTLLPPPEEVVNAIDWFANIVEGVADTWGSWDPVNNERDSQLAGVALMPYSWEYEFEEFLNGDQALIRMLAHTSDSNAPVQVPTVEVALVDSTMADATRSVGPNGEHDFSYLWTEPELPEDRPRTFKLENLDVLNTENAWGSVRLARNLKLNSPGYSPSAGRQTNPSFVYQTPESRFVNKITPLLDTIVPVVLPGGGLKSLEAHLVVMLESLFASAGSQNIERLLKLGVRYAYDVRGLRGEDPLAKGPDQLDEFISYMPVLQRMPFKFRPDAAGRNSLAAELAGEMNAWFNQVKPERAHAYYEFDVSIFAALSVTDLPVLRLRRIWLGLERVNG